MVTTGATEDAAARRVIAGQKPACIAGWGTDSKPIVILAEVANPEGWSEVDGALQREFTFPNFADALAFVNRVGELAEAENHHPDIELGWSRVVLRWRTHSADAITDRDREMAARSGELA